MVAAAASVCVCAAYVVALCYHLLEPKHDRNKFSFQLKGNKWRGVEGTMQCCFSSHLASFLCSRPYTG